MRVLILDLDTLRPDHLGCYGYCRDTSPNIDRVAQEGVRFNNYYCSDAPCLPARAALITGKHGIHSGVVNHGGTAADLRLEGCDRGFNTKLNKDSLWRIFRNQGMRVASISPFAERHSAWWFLAGMTENYNTGSGGIESAEAITPTVLDWIERNGKEDDWVLHVNYWDPHTPYRAPAEFGNPFEDDPLPEWYTAETLEQHRSLPGGHSSRELNMFSGDESDERRERWPRQPGEIKDMNDFRRMIDGYDCGIRYMDEHIGKLFAALEKADVMDDLAIIVTSDHGENLGELNSYAEHGTSDHITHRIPMIIRWPGCQQGHVDTGLHYNLDLSPTLADLFGQQAATDWDGRSYASTLRTGANSGQDYLVLGQCCHGAQRSVRFGPWIYIRTYHDFYHLYPDEMLFNVDDDPHEQHDLAKENPDICKQAAAILNNWHAEMMETSPSDIDPLQTVLDEGGPFHSKGHLPSYCERLEATGRGQYVEELKKRHPGEFQ